MKTFLLVVCALWITAANAADPTWNTSSVGYGMLKDAGWQFRVKAGMCQALPPGRRWDDPPRREKGNNPGTPIISGPVVQAPRADGRCYAEDALKGTAL